MLPAASVMIGASAHAQTLQLQENLPYSSAGKATPGFMLQVVREMERVMDKPMPEKIMAWPDAQKSVREGQDGVIFPFSRTAEREPNYKWVLKFWDIHEMFFARPGAPTATSFEEAAKMPSVGVVGGSAQEGFLKAHGLANVHGLANAGAVAAAVASGEVAVGYGPMIEM